MENMAMEILIEELKLASRHIENFKLLHLHFNFCIFSFVLMKTNHKKLCNV